MIDISKFRIINDFPKPGIKFYDITTVLNDKDAFRETFDEMVKVAKRLKPDVIIALETRGYFFGPALALALDIPFAPIRKKGKLPYTTYKSDYQLEYGTDTIEIHTDAIKENQRVLIFDDILATGGTASAAIHLINNFKPARTDVMFIMEISAMNGKAKLGDANSVNCLLSV